MKHRLVDVYPYRILDGGAVEHLLLHRAQGAVYSGEWRMVGGKVEDSESAWQAGLRELSEETGLKPVRFWALPSVNSFYEWQSDAVHHIPAFAAEVDRNPVLDHEHDDFAWLSLEDALIRMAWPEQCRLLRLLDSYLRRSVPPELLIVPPTG